MEENSKRGLGGSTTFLEDPADEKQEEDHQDVSTQGRSSGGLDPAVLEQAVCKAIESAASGHPSLQRMAPVVCIWGWPVGTMTINIRLKSAAHVATTSDADALCDKLVSTLQLPESCVRSAKITNGTQAVLEVSGLDQREESLVIETLTSGKTSSSALAQLGVDLVQVGNRNDGALQLARAAEGELASLREASSS